jgi:tRNA pseudouridine38-40 synthase
LRTWLLLLTYCGTRYAGWQVQPVLPTVESEIEKALQQLTGTFQKVLGSGRTDAGVHALNYPAHFQSSRNFTAIQWHKALNGLLPPDIVVRYVVEKPIHFHARHKSIGKRYAYLIHNAQQRNPFTENHSWWIRRSLDVKAMRTAAECLLGRHDFSSFRASHCSGSDPVKELREITIGKTVSPWGNLIMEFEANSFLQHMVRILAGTLVEVGLRKREAISMKEILKQRDRTKAGKTAPSGGLYQLAVHYPNDLVNWPKELLINPFKIIENPEEHRK